MDAPKAGNCSSLQYIAFCTLGWKMAQVCCGILITVGWLCTTSPNPLCSSESLEVSEIETNLDFVLETLQYW